MRVFRFYELYDVAFNLLGAKPSRSNDSFIRAFNFGNKKNKNGELRFIVESFGLARQSKRLSSDK